MICLFSFINRDRLLIVRVEKQSFLNRSRKKYFLESELEPVGHRGVGVGVGVGLIPRTKPKICRCVLSSSWVGWIHGRISLLFGLDSFLGSWLLGCGIHTDLLSSFLGRALGSFLGWALGNFLHSWLCSFLGALGGLDRFLGSWFPAFLGDFGFLALTAFFEAGFLATFFSACFSMQC